MMFCKIYLFISCLDDENSNEYVTLLGKPNKESVEREKKLTEDFEKLGPLTSKHLLIWSYQIAKGMEYLGSMKV